MYDYESRPKTGLFIGLGACVVIVAVFAFYWWNQKPERVPAPTAYKTYVARDKAFTCVSPGGWKRAGAGMNGMLSSARFHKGDARIDIVADLAGSLVGDIARLGGGMPTIPTEGLSPDLKAVVERMPKQKPVVETLHIAAGKRLAKRMAEYKEKPMIPLTTALGEGRVSEWTAIENGFPHSLKKRGYRVTIMGTERQITVLCQCNEADWKSLKPAFERVVSSLAPGGA